MTEPTDVDEGMLRLALAAVFMHGLLSGTVSQTFTDSDDARIARAFRIAGAFIERMKAEP